MLDRIEDKASGTENIFGVTPRYEDLKWDGIAFTQEQFNTITSIDKAAWEAELKLHAELFEKLKYHLPKELESAKAQLEKRLAA
jgi:phosphoenolpyruvate carboxykinase (GTP)